MDETLQRFSNYIEKDSGASLNTRLSYLRDIRMMMEWLSARGIVSVAQISAQNLQDYTEWMKDQGKSSATISRSIASMHRFFDFAVRQGEAFEDPSRRLKAPKVIRRTPEIVEESDLGRLLEMPDLDRPKGKRDKAMLEMLITTGLKVSELISLRLSDVDVCKKTVHVSGSKERSIPLTRKVVKSVEAYLEDARPEFVTDAKEETLFVSCEGEKMTRQGFWKLIRKYGKDAHLESELTPHMLRHSYAVNALRKGEDVHELQAILGHKDLNSTIEYSHLV